MFFPKQGLDRNIHHKVLFCEQYFISAVGCYLMSQHRWQIFNIQLIPL